MKVLQSADWYVASYCGMQYSYLSDIANSVDVLITSAFQDQSVYRDNIVDATMLACQSFANPVSTAASTTSFNCLKEWFSCKLSNSRTHCLLRDDTLAKGKAT